MGEIIAAILVIGYVVISWWAVNKVLYEGKVVIYSNIGNFYLKRLALSVMFGWIFIPLAILKSIFFH